MESEKVKEIKNALKFCCDDCDCNCPFYKNGKSYKGCKSLLLFKALTLINELESENERLLAQRNKTYNIWVKDTEKLKDRIAELEDKIENGTMIELPCKVGDTVYTNIIGTGLQNAFTISSVDLLGFSDGTYSWTWHQLGKSVFLTREEAEKN